MSHCGQLPTLVLDFDKSVDSFLHEPLQPVAHKLAYDLKLCNGLPDIHVVEVQNVIDAADEFITYGLRLEACFPLVHANKE